MDEQRSLPGEQRSEPSVGEAEPSAQIVERRSRLRRSYAELEPHRHVTTRCCCYVHRGLLLRKLDRTDGRGIDWCLID